MTLSMKLSITLLLIILSSSCLAGELFCEAWYQEQDMPLEKQLMNVLSANRDEKVFVAPFKGYDFEVKWHYELTTLYTFIKKDSKNILATTARVPTDNHPEAFTDLHLPDGPRLSVNCEVH